MSDCVLPVTGSNPQLVLLALLAVVIGVALVIGVRRRGIRGGAAMVVAFALAAAGLVLSDARRADAQECPPSTTVAPTTAPTTTAAPTTVPATTSTLATTTTASTTTTTSPPTTPQVFPTTPTTAATTTTVGGPDLTPTIEGASTQGVADFPGPLFTITITNVGTAPTSGPMTFTMTPSVVTGSGILNVSSTSTADWTVMEFGADSLLISSSSLVLAPGDTTTVTFNVAWQLDLVVGGSYKLDVVLPNGIGGDANDANNTVSHTVTVVPPPG
jgi:hypothetical protein